MVAPVLLAMNMIRRIDYDGDMGTLFRSLPDDINECTEVVKSEWG
jgi:hypothetical protein